MIDPALEKINQLTEQNYPIVYFETLRSVHIVKLFKNLSLASSKAIYHWQPETGMYRMDASHIMIPRSVEPEDLLNTINSMAHFGVFVLTNFDQHIKNRRVVELLKKISAMHKVNPKMVILLGSKLEIPDDLRPAVAHIRHTMRSTSDDDDERKVG
ncbi:MAG: hypothetical protein KAT25_07995 [Sulfuriflexus sp.]|nr:hypothetical protein [Sulfuriflexus sp.]